MKIFLLILVNIAVIAIFIALMRRKNTLSYFSNGRWWLTWLSIAVITLMDELTSIFYAPSEAFRFIGSHAIFFIAFTSLALSSKIDFTIIMKLPRLFPEYDFLIEYEGKSKKIK